jgi:biopolymer transport protein ExbD/outer membrane biosynthesis protein TonB
MTRTGRIASVLVLVAVGCSKDGEQAPARGPDSPAEAAAPLRVEVGDCAGPQVSFVSGPRPEPVSPDGAGPRAADVSGDQPGGAFASLTGTGDLSSGLDDQDIYGGLLGNEVGEMQGGFGFGRTGAEPGGGTGWGTIGTGRYGTIGHGSGTGSGYGIGSGGRGGMRGRRAQEPQVAIGNASATGDLDKNIIRRYIRRKLPHVRYCYEKQLIAKPKLAGRVDIQFVIDAAGNVTSAAAKGMDPEVASCISTAIKSIQFPKPKGGGIVKVSYPFNFRPSGSAPSQPATPPPGEETDKDSTEEPRAEGQYKMKSNADDPQLAKKQAIDQARSAGILGAIEPAAATQSPAPPYRPGAQSPLRGHEPMLATCLRKQPSAHGVAVIELDIDAAGAIKSSSVHGVGGEVPACIAAAVKQLNVPGAAAGVQRCPVAFGAMPIRDARGVDITSADVTVDGKKVADVAAIAADAADALKIEPLYELMRPTVEENGAPPPAPVVAVRGPIILRAIDEAPMKVVTRTVVTLAMAGSDYLLAAQQGVGWRLLRAVDLPVVPVAAGTGGSWNPALRRVSRVAIAVPREAAPIASVLVRKDTIWVGTTGSVAEPVTIPAGTGQATQLAEALRAIKQLPAFASRRDIEIAAEDDAIYRQLVAAIDAAGKAGFTDWNLVTSASLSSAPQP